MNFHPPSIKFYEITTIFRKILNCANSSRYIRRRESRDCTPQRSSQDSIDRAKLSVRPQLSPETNASSVQRVLRRTLGSGGIFKSRIYLAPGREIRPGLFPNGPCLAERAVLRQRQFLRNKKASDVRTKRYSLTAYFRRDICPPAPKRGKERIFLRGARPHRHTQPGTVASGHRSCDPHAGRGSRKGQLGLLGGRKEALSGRQRPPGRRLKPLRARSARRGS